MFVEVEGVKVEGHAGRGMAGGGEGGMWLVEAVVGHHGSVQFVLIMLSQQVGGGDDLRGKFSRSLAGRLVEALDDTLSIIQMRGTGTNLAFVYTSLAHTTLHITELVVATQVLWRMGQRRRNEGIVRQVLVLAALDGDARGGDRIGMCVVVVEGSGRRFNASR
jgi:hypothetical protein